MAKEVIVRGYSKTAWGKGFNVKSYKRGVGSKGLPLWGRNKARAPQAIPPPVPPKEGTKEWYDQWDENARRIERERQASIWKKAIDTDNKFVQEIDAKQRDMFERAEEKIASFVEKYTKKNYKRVL